MRHGESAETVRRKAETEEKRGMEAYRDLMKVCDLAEAQLILNAIQAGRIRHVKWEPE